VPPPLPQCKKDPTIEIIDLYLAPEVAAESNQLPDEKSLLEPSKSASKKDTIPDYTQKPSEGKELEVFRIICQDYSTEDSEDDEGLIFEESETWDPGYAHNFHLGHSECWWNTNIEEEMFYDTRIDPEDPEWLLPLDDDAEMDWDY
ncbi:17944_t:CDS:2, partial [Racocetra persica]